MILNVLDLFAGTGGFSLGLEKTGRFKTVGFVEWNTDAQIVLRRHWPDTPIYGDITTVTKDVIHSKIDVLTGGFPCTDLSNGLSRRVGDGKLYLMLGNSLSPLIIEVIGNAILKEN